MDDKEIVSAVRDLLAGKVGLDDFELWFNSDTRLVWQDGKLRIGTTSRFAQDWMRSRFTAAIESACQTVTGQPAAIEFYLIDSSSDARGGVSGAQPDNSGAVGDGAPAESRAAQLLSLETAARSHNTGLASASLSNVRRGAPSHGFRARVRPREAHLIGAARSASAPELAPRRRFASFETFVVGSANRLASATSQMVVEKPGSLTPLVLFGPSGSGKTHLLESIWSAAVRSRDGINAVYLSAEQFTTLFVGALRGSGLPNFRRKYRGVDLLIVDDLQFLAGKRATLVELQHTIDSLTRDGKQLVFAADRSPADLTELGPELRTRLAGGMVCQLEQPDMQIRVGLAKQFASRLEMKLEDEVAQYIAAHITGGAREIAGAVNRLHADSYIEKRPVDRELAEASLAEMLQYHTKPVRLADIDRAVCDVFGLSGDTLHGAARAKSVSSARMLAMWLARKHTRAGLTEIGQHFGRRSHSTVISAQKRVSDWVERQHDVEVADRRCKIDEAIRQIEQRLCAG